MHIHLIFILLIFVVFGCQNISYEGFRDRGRAKTQEIIKELKLIRTKDQLVLHEAHLRKKFQELKKLMEEVDHFRAMHPEKGGLSLEAKDHELSDQLRTEIVRIQRLDGGREILFY